MNACVHKASGDAWRGVLSLSCSITQLGRGVRAPGQSKRLKYFTEM